MQSKFITLLATIVAVQAAAVPEPSATLGPGPELPPGFVSAKGGALDAPEPTAAPAAGAMAAQAWAGVMTVTYANHDGAEIRVAHRQGSGSPSPLNPFNRDARIKDGGQEVVHYPAGYHGAAFLNRANLYDEEFLTGYF